MFAYCLLTVAVIWLHGLISKVCYYIASDSLTLALYETQTPKRFTSIFIQRSVGAAWSIIIH